MRSVVWLLGIFAAAVGVAIVLSYNSAYALIVWAPWRVHISLNLLAILLLCVFILGYIALRLLSRALALPGAVQAYRAKLRSERAAMALRDAQRLLFEGRYGRAFAQAVVAHDAGVSPGMSALIAARAAHAMREHSRCEEWLGRAAEHDNEVRSARLMTEAEFALADRDYALAAERLETLRAGGARQIAALRLSLQAAAALGQWSEVLRLARQLAKHRALSQEQAAPLVRRAHIECLRELEGDEAALIRYWKQLPRGEREDRVLVRDAVPLLVAAGEPDLASNAIAEAIDAEWDSTLAEQLGRLEGGNTVERIALAERWLKRQPDDELLLLALGRLCIRQQLWGKALSYLEASLSVRSTRPAHLELARLCERMDRPEQALMHFRKAAELEH